MLACPAFYNLCCLVAKNDFLFPDRSLVSRFGELSKYFDQHFLLMASEGASTDVNKYNRTRVVDAQVIFAEEIGDFNPENVH